MKLLDPACIYEVRKTPPSMLELHIDHVAPSAGDRCSRAYRVNAMQTVCVCFCAEHQQTAGHQRHRELSYTW